MVALLALPAIDIALLAYGSPASVAGAGLATLLPVVADGFAAACFWIGLFLLVRSALRAAADAPAVPRALLVGAASLLVGTTIAYHALLWSFIGLNGHPPSAETLVFALRNASRLPQHVLQTAPLAALTVTAAALLSAVLLMRLIAAQLRRRPADSLRRKALHAGVLLTAWHAVAGAGTNSAPARILLDPARIADARIDLALQSLPPRPAAAAIVPDGRRRPSVVVILVESLRHDLLATHPEAVPFLRELYAKHAGFARAYATASHSDLSDLAFWYAQYPLRGPGRESYPVDADWRGTSLFDLFQAYGYATAYVSSQNERWGDMINWLRTPAVDYWFHSESFDGATWFNADDADGIAKLIRRGVTGAGKVEDSQTLAIAGRWIDSLPPGEPFFLGMNLQNTHFSYLVTPGAAEPYQPTELGFRAVYYRWPEEQRANVRNRYLNSVHNLDRLLRDFAAQLQARGRWDDTLFVVVGDNGEAFYEHGFGNHSGPMYDEVVRTLAVIKPPAGTALPLGSLDRPVSHVDLAATIPDLVGLPRPWSFQGRSVASNDCSRRPVFMYSNAMVRQYGTVAWPWKYLVTEFPVAREELYDLAADPAERHDRAAQRPDVAAALAASLRTWASLQQRYYAEGVYRDRVPPDHCGDGGAPDRIRSAERSTASTRGAPGAPDP